MQSTKADKKTLELAQDYASNNHSILDRISNTDDKEYLKDIMTLLSKREN